jgi:hypothetical protein
MILRGAYVVFVYVFLTYIGFVIWTALAAVLLWFLALLRWPSLDRRWSLALLLPLPPLALLVYALNLRTHRIGNLTQTALAIGLAYAIFIVPRFLFRRLRPGRLRGVRDGVSGTAPAPASPSGG